ncbi:Cell wall-associated hydrolase [Lactobacillus delbrueckii subsp. bulgaricus]|nr:hypothetical protein [Lactobacillus delbrueckii]AXI15777.1 Cell wall-associated hydrolase [Lactobacillus delbrueckii subsp. bulgaricus]
MKRKFSLVLLLLAAWLGGAQPAYAATDSQDSNITIVKKTRVAYNKGNKVNTWTTYGAGKKLVGQVKSGYGSSPVQGPDLVPDQGQQVDSGD